MLFKLIKSLLISYAYNQHTFVKVCTLLTIQKIVIGFYYQKNKIKNIKPMDLDCAKLINYLVNKKLNYTFIVD